MSLPQDLSPTHPNQNLGNPCRNGCGFHGNPEWNGYCSKCYRELVVQGTDAGMKSLRAGSPRGGSDGRGRAETIAVDRPASLQFSKFESKKKTQATTKKLFCPNDTDDEQRDCTLQLTMRKLRWLKVSHLGLDVKLESLSHNMKQSVKDAQKELVAIDTKRSPQDKLKSVVKCSKHIFEVLYAWNNGPAGVDQYLPMLIYVIVQAVPPRLHSNIEYIQRFANPVRLSSGESSYYFTNLCGAVSFIKSISAEALHMTQDEFDGYLASNELLDSPDGSCDEIMETDNDPLTVMKIELEKCGLDLPTDEELMPSDDDILVPDVEQFEPLRIMRSSNQAMIELSKKLEELRNRALALQDEVEAFRQSLAAEVAKILNYKKEPNEQKLEQSPQPIATQV